MSGTGVTDDPTWNDASGDFEVTTADDVRFRVPSEYLFVASPVWKTARDLSNNGDKTMIFTDPQIETAPVFRLFLCLVANGEMPDPTGNRDTVVLITFLTKWECTTILQLVMLLIRDQIFFQGLGNPAIAFWSAAAVGDSFTCKAVLWMHPGSTWADGFDLRDSPDPNNPVLGACVWDSNSWSVWERDNLRPDYAWALGAAYSKVGRSRKLGDMFAFYLSEP